MSTQDKKFSEPVRLQTDGNFLLVIYGKFNYCLNDLLFLSSNVHLILHSFIIEVNTDLFRSLVLSCKPQQPWALNRFLQAISVILSLGRKEQRVSVSYVIYASDGVESDVLLCLPSSKYLENVGSSNVQTLQENEIF